MTIYIPDKFKPRFPLGKLVITPGARKILSDEDILLAISQHQRGDWGILSDKDWGSNEEALKTGGRLLSVYRYHGVKIWIITEADRSATTILLPDEY